MSKAEDKLVNNSIDSHSPADEVQCSIIWVIEDEMFPIEIRQVVSSNTTSDGRDVIDIRLLYHSSHSLLNSTLAKLELGMLVPYGFKVEIWTTHQRLEERETSCVSNRGRCALEVIVRGNCKEWFEVRVFVMF